MKFKSTRLISIILVWALLFTAVSLPVTVNADTTATVTVTPTVSANVKPSATTMPGATATDDASEIPSGSSETSSPNSTSTPPQPTATAEPTSKPKSKKLRNAKKEAKTELRNYLDINEYSNDDKELIETLLKAAEKDIDKLTTVKEVKAYVKMAKKVFDDIPTLAEMNGMAKVKVNFVKDTVKVKVGKKFKLKAKLKPSKGLGKVAKKVKWAIDKKGKKVVGFVEKAKKLQGKLVVRLKAKKKGRAKITCKAPNGRAAVCMIIAK